LFSYLQELFQYFNSFECHAKVFIIYLSLSRVALGLKHNGTAVEGVCVTGAASRILVPVLSSEVVPVASQYGAIFAITVSVGFVTIAVQVVCL
jgi:hypothetical protein